ncbi:MAG TPA: hypothetical protein VMV47_17880 [Bacteroidales bacterium]|nr:hypothetical protein [Bacteroidales bacterium]
MNRLWTTVAIIFMMLVFIGYMVFDLVFRKDNVPETNYEKVDSMLKDQWLVNNIIESGKEKLKAVAVSENGNILLAGDSYIDCYDSDLKILWQKATDGEVTALAVSKTKIFAAIGNYILVLGHAGENNAEWGPWDEKAFITSIAVNDNYVAFADAAGKSIFILDTDGNLKQLIGKGDEQFIVPSPYFDIAFGKNDTLYVANTGKLRVERRKTDGTLIDYFGEPGLAPDSFCGCCNPAHFAMLDNGLVTAEKGVNRIKILDGKGRFIEYVSSVNKFLPPVPLDIAVSPDGNLIYAANPADSKLYVFKRK